MSVRIITDSTADISQEAARDRNLSIVPLKVIFADGSYLDGVDMKPGEFYRKLVEANPLPTTSQPSPDDFLPVFEEIRDCGDEAVVLTISSGISGTFQSAKIARETCGCDRIHIIDTLHASISLGILVERALTLRGEGKSAQEIAEILEQEKLRVRLHITVDTLEFLRKGGRLSRTVAFAGSLLGLKPVIGLVGGVVEMQGKGRGFQKAFEEIYNLIEKNGSIDRTLPQRVGYTGSSDSANAFLSFLQEKYTDIAPDVYIMGSVIGTHVGPGGCAIAYFANSNSDHIVVNG